MMRWLEGYLSECLAEIPEEVLVQLAPVVEETGTSAASTGLTPTTPSSAPGNTKWRDLAFDAYESARMNSGAPQPACVPSATPLCWVCPRLYASSLQEKLYKGMKSGGHHLSASKSSLEQIQCYSKGLGYIAYQAVRLALSSVPADVRAKEAGKVQRYSYRLGRALLAMTNRCDDYNEAKGFF